MSEPSELNAKDHIAELTERIVVGYVGKHVVPVAELPSLISHVNWALEKAATHVTSEAEDAPAAKPKPAVSIRKSIQRDYLVCLDDGKKFKSLKRHLTSLGLTPDAYREKWGLPADYPMVAPAYAEVRTRLAKEAGLGGHQRGRKRKG